jgi:anthranilate phosphoribosyltransferase
MANDVASVTTDQIVAAARRLRDAAPRVKAEWPLLDTAGTGGDGTKTFNISTAVAIVAAAAGAHVAKQHDQALSSQCGSTDLLDELGIASDLSSDAAAACLRETGICFLCASRSQVGGPLPLNVAAPLANPAGAQHQLLGVADGTLAPKIAQALLQLGTTHSLVIRGDDGMDEITCTGTTTVYEVKNGEISTWSLDPRAYGYLVAPRHAILGGDAVENALIARVVLSGRPSTYLEVVQMNTAAALYAADRVSSIDEGLALAKDTLKSGAAIRKLDQVVEVSQQLKAAGAAR